MNTKLEILKAKYVFSRRMYEITGENKYLDNYIKDYCEMFQKWREDDPNNHYVRLM